MEGYVIVLTPENGDDTTPSYWDGNLPNEDLQNSAIFKNKTEAKIASGDLVKKYTDHNINVLPVRTTIEIVK